MTALAFEYVVSERDLQAQLWALDTALNPVAIAGFLGAEVDPYIRKRAQQRFAGEGDDVVGKWAPLHEATQNIRESMGYGASGPINRREDELMHYVVDSPHRINVHTLGATLIMPGYPPKGELRDKVTTAQAGRVKPKTVARPVIGINERDLTAVLTMLFLYISRSTQGRRKL